VRHGRRLPRKAVQPDQALAQRRRPLHLLTFGIADRQKQLCACLIASLRSGMLFYIHEL
jgi:hypothetical protein